MSQPTSVNPYSAWVSLYFGPGLDSIIGAMGFPATTLDNLVNYLYAYVAAQSWYSSLGQPSSVEVSASANTALSKYMYGECMGMYSGVQRAYIKEMIGPSFTNYITVDTLADRISNIQQMIFQSKMSVQQQMPLLLATATGNAANTYYQAAIAAGGASPWNSYFTAAQSSALANLPFWVAASMEGALIGAKSVPTGLITPTTTTNPDNAILLSSFIAALALTPAKVMFNLIRQFQYSSMSLGSQMGAGVQAGCGCKH